MQLAMGTWCLMCFVLVTSYSSVLTSFIMAPRYQPLISSINQLAKSKVANPVVINGLGADVVITVNYAINRIYLFFLKLILIFFQYSELRGPNYERTKP